MRRKDKPDESRTSAQCDSRTDGKKKRADVLLNTVTKAVPTTVERVKNSRV